MGRASVADPETDLVCALFTNRAFASGWAADRPRPTLFANAVVAARVGDPSGLSKESRPIWSASDSHSSISWRAPVADLSSRGPLLERCGRAPRAAGLGSALGAAHDPQLAAGGCDRIGGSHSDQCAVRGAVTDDGSRFWVTGGTGGVRLAPFGTIGSTTQVAANPDNARVPTIADGQLFASSASGVFQGVNTVGLGLPRAPR